MKNLWIRYTHEDTENANVTSTADNEQEARKERRVPWYRYDVGEPTPETGDGALTNETGPFYF